MQEQERLYAQADALDADACIAFCKAHNLDYGAGLWQYRQKHKRRVKRSKPQQRKIISIQQNGLCAFCKDTLVNHSTRLDHETNKLLHANCQLIVAAVRKMIADGITLDRLADYLQIIPPKPPLDVFGPDAPDVDV